ncbi:MAG TPA: replicative DNA helicase [Erysipelothrix sp.]
MRQLPFSREAELAVLGSLLVYPETVSSVIEYDMIADDFFDKNHQTIFKHMQYLIDNNRIIDPALLVDRLESNHELEQVGGVEYLMMLTNNSAAPSSIKFYIDLVQEKAQIRRLIHVGQNITEKGFDTTVELNELLDIAEQQILEVTRVRRTNELLSSREVVQDFLDNLNKIRESTERITGLKTGYSSLNNVTNGLQRGDLVILAARPSMGKTAFALNLALNVARFNDDGEAAVVVFSLEMPARHLISRMVSAQSSIKSDFLRSGRLDDDQMNELHVAANALSQLNMYIDDSSTITMPEIFSKCRKLKAENRLDMVVIDYIQLITGRGGTESRQQEVSEISRSLKQLAREMDVPVIGLSQLSRSVEKRDVKIPQLSDLRESGSIEQDADIVMFLYREDYYQNQGDDEERDEREVKETLLKISKHRNGALADLTLQFNPSISKFYDVAKEGW